MHLKQEHKLLNTYAVRHYESDNGFQALLVHNPISPVAAYLTLYTVGSASEADDQRGLAHFFEHMMFRETEALGDGDIDRIMAEIGGVGLNAYTSYDATAYHVNVPADQLGRVIELEADRMVNLRLSPDLIERERGAVLGEMKMYKDMPSEQLWEKVMAESFPAHPYRHPIVGYMDQVEGFGDEDFRRFYRQHYAPNRALVVIAGGFDEDQLVARLEAAYGGLPMGSPRPEPQQGSQSGESGALEGKRLEIFHDKISTENLVLISRGWGLRDPSTPPLLMLTSLLAAGQSSPLYRCLVLDGLATHVSANLLDAEMMLVSPGIFAIEVALRHGVRAEEAETAIGEALLHLQREGISDEELTRARNQVRLSFYGGMRSNMSLARQVGGYALACGDPMFSEKLLRAAEDASAEAVAEALESVADISARITVVQRPGSGAGA